LHSTNTRTGAVIGWCGHAVDAPCAAGTRTRKRALPVVTLRPAARCAARARNPRRPGRRASYEL